MIEYKLVDDQTNILGDKIRMYRQMREMNQIQLAEASGINVGTIRKYELGLRKPKPDQLEKIAAALHLNVSVFLDININTIGDVLSLLFTIDNACDMNVNCQEDENGNKTDIGRIYGIPKYGDGRQIFVFSTEKKYSARYIEITVHTVESAVHFIGEILVYSHRSDEKSGELYPEVVIEAGEFKGYVQCEKMALLDLNVRGYKIIDRIELTDIMNITDAIQAIFDYIAGMTDRYCVKVFNELINY